MRRNVAFLGTAVVVVSAVVNVAHTASHAGLHLMSLPGWQLAYIAIVIYAAPVVAASLLWTRYRFAGAWLLAASMAGSFAFGLLYHFVIPGPDNVFTQPPGTWRTAFGVSAALLLPCYRVPDAWSGCGRRERCPAGCPTARHGPSEAALLVRAELPEGASDDREQFVARVHARRFRPALPAPLLDSLPDARQRRGRRGRRAGSLPALAAGFGYSLAEGLPRHRGDPPVPGPPAQGEDAAR